MSITLEMPLLVKRKTLNSGDPLLVFRALSERMATVLEEVSGEVDVNRWLDQCTAVLWETVSDFTGHLSAHMPNPLFDGVFFTIGTFSIDLPSGGWLPMSLVAQFEPQAVDGEVHLIITALDLDEVDTFIT